MTTTQANNPSIYTVQPDGCSDQRSIILSEYTAYQIQAVEVSILAVPYHLKRPYIDMLLHLFDSDFKHQERCIWFEAYISHFEYSVETRTNKSIQGIGVCLNPDIHLHPIFVVSSHLARPAVKTSLATSALTANMSAEVCIDLGDCRAWCPCLIVELTNTERASIILMGSTRNPHYGLTRHYVPLHRLRRVCWSPNYYQLGGLLQEHLHLTSEEASVWNDVSLNTLNFSDAQILSIKTTFIESSLRVCIVGTPSHVARLKQLVLKMTSEEQQKRSFHEKKSRRFDLLAQRRKTLNYECMIEFQINKDYIGFIIGNRGARLGHIAQSHQTELRILPINNGQRHFRIYGNDSKQVEQAYMDVQLSFQDLKIIHPATFYDVCHQRVKLEFIANESGILLLWINERTKSFFIFGSLRCNESFAKLFSTIFFMNILR